MTVLFYGTILFLIAFFFHLTVWKIRLPDNQTKTLLVIFIVILTAGIAVLKIFPSRITIFCLTPPVATHRYLQLCFFYLSLSIAYITTYSALEVDSPSLVIILKIAGAGSEGLDKNALENEMGNNVLVLPRLRDLAAVKMVNFDGKTYMLSPRGILLARIFVLYRKILKKDPEGG